MRVLSRSVYLGPSLYAHFPVIRLVLDLEALEEWPSGRLGAPFTDGLLEALPGLREHGCSYGEPGGFVRRLTEDDGTWMGHILEHVAIELQNIAGSRVTFGKTRGTGEPGHYDVVFQYQQQDVGLEAGDLALELLRHLLPAEARDREPEEPFTWEERRDGFIRSSQRRALGPSTASLVAAAEARGIPWLRLNRYSLVQFGHGRHGKRIQATVTSETRHIAVELASDKEETNKILGDLGLRCRDSDWSTAPRRRCARPSGSAIRSSSSRSTPTTAAACRSTSPIRSRWRRPSRTPGTTAAPCSSRAISRASTIGSW
jgi:cyanophycin synthetase